jgi:hypothetical protein
MTYNLDMQTNDAIVSRLASIVNRANMFNHDRDDILEEIAYFVQTLKINAALIEKRMISEAA